MNGRLLSCFVSLILSFFFLNCSASIPGSREECYAKNYCDSAVSDCISGGMLACAFTGSQPSPDNSDLFCNTTFNALTCAGAKSSCISDCDRQHYY
ncbi:LA_0364 family Cys-rich lipoprotein [Leptospira wolffii]|uniref:LA_0364 family Cys-rich lipoprotein n=1 Tax=Leptospira wolffii TaxID=409998 RepID=A0ABV5BRW1_9LEPT|nr:hypothetical protein [Leptospira wolffii]TGL51824.1 hypothetical protein EHQ61_07635 [Leptospira wolffii]